MYLIFSILIKKKSYLCTRYILFCRLGRVLRKSAQFKMWKSVIKFPGKQCMIKSGKS